MNPSTKRSKNKKNPSRHFGLIALGVVTAILLAAVLIPSNQPEEIGISEFAQNIKANKYESVENIDGKAFEAYVADNEDSVERALLETGTAASGVEQLKQLGVSEQQIIDLDIKNGTTEGGFGSIAGTFFVLFGPVILILGLVYYMMRQAQGANSQAMGFGKSKARVFGEDKAKSKFKDIAGSAEAKEELQEIVDFLKFPKKFQDVGAKIPKGVMMIGPPGTGKTMLARAVAGEAGVPFFSISGSEFVEMFVGVGASRVRDLFSKAKKNAPCIIFIDEIDAVGRRRGSGMGGGHDEREQTLNQILTEMDGFEQGTNVIVVAATNRPDVLDPALLRPGRFDRRVTLDLPDRKDRQAIMDVHIKGKPVEDGVDWDGLAGKTSGMSGADLQNVANEAAILAVRRKRTTIGNKDFDDAFEKVAIGPERKGRVMTHKEKELTAYHEGGHALVGHVLPHSDPIHKVTIISRGRAGGVTWSIPKEDKNYHSVVEFRDKLAHALGGRVAEELMYGEENVTTGAGSDIQSATSMARDMITRYGMSEKLPNLFLESEGGGMLLDREFASTKAYSNATAEIIDTETAALMKEAYDRAKAVITENKDQLEAIKDALMDKETVDSTAVTELFKTAINPETGEISKKSAESAKEKAAEGTKAKTETKTETDEKTDDKKDKAKS